MSTLLKISTTIIIRASERARSNPGFPGTFGGSESALDKMDDSGEKSKESSASASVSTNTTHSLIRTVREKAALVWDTGRAHISRPFEMIEELDEAADVYIHEGFRAIHSVPRAATVGSFSFGLASITYLRSGKLQAIRTLCATGLVTCALLYPQCVVSYIEEVPAFLEKGGYQ